MPLLDSLIARGAEGDPAFLAGAAATVAAGCALCATLYRLWLHPLAKIPGPKYMAISDIFSQWHHFISLDMSPYAIELHRKYGPVVRIGPNRVIVAGSVAWLQVYGVRGSSGVGEFGKTQGFLYPTDHMALLGAPWEDHRRQRRQLNHAFSVAALHEQEPIITQYVNRLMEELAARATRGEAVDIVQWLNLCTFDVIGDLCFGESFQGLEGNTTFVDNTFRMLIGNSCIRFLNQYPLLKIPLMILLGTKETKVALEAGKANAGLGKVKAQARMAKGDYEDGRRDFATYMLRKGKDGERGLSDAEVGALSSILVLAGSETTATALSGFVYFLSRPENAEKRRILEDEIRAAFADDADINMTSTGHLEYLRVFLEETMRMYPPAATMTPRISPGAEVGGYWLPQGSLIHVYSNAAYRDPANFTDPDSFHPERWLKPAHPQHDARFDSDKKEVFKPFSFGARDCIGKNLAYAEMRVIASRLVYNFDFKLLPGQDDWMAKQPNTLLWLKEGFKVQPSLHKKAVAA
ncbi:cytochrome P450 [Microdochium trichocladiopsis]|uniref:Cytochrome P450 n=1 Tax=Microdochium trichocladiopsis TaxID=1682393 RepID=A0A9P9BJ45_9PEZI|nr:cytochrome P450 [Microdochium trichocladiopsis]KAH7024893.1 cytochrome P450 [Microdochium trichocladiopsis]